MENANRGSREPDNSENKTPAPRPEIAGFAEYVPGRSQEEIREQYGLERVYKLASNENPLGPSPKAIEALKSVADEVFRYPRGDAPELRRALAEKNKLDAAQVVLSNGSDEMIWMICTAWLRPSDLVVSSQPTFSEYGFCTKLCGGIYQEVPMGAWSHNLDELASAAAKARIVFLCNPNNPTGTWVKPAEMQTFLNSVPNDVLVVVDQAYCEYAYEEQQRGEYDDLLSDLGHRGNLILLRTFSKLYGLAGLRVGYSLSSAEISAVLMKVKQPFNVNLPAQAAALAALDDEQHLQDTLSLNAKGKAEWTQFLSEFGWNVLPSVANFICVQVGEQAEQLTGYMESQGLIIRHLKSFGMPEWIRITIGTPEENQLFMQGLKSFQAQNQAE